MYIHNLRFNLIYKVIVYNFTGCPAVFPIRPLKKNPFSEREFSYCEYSASRLLSFEMIKLKKEIA